MTGAALPISRRAAVCACALATLFAATLSAGAPDASAQAKTRIVYMQGDQIRSVRPDGSHNRRIAKLKGLVDISATDNGRRIAAVSVGERTTPVGEKVVVARIVSMRGDGSDVRVVRDIADEDVRTVGLSPDGRHLRYQTDDEADFAFSGTGFAAFDQTNNGDRDVVISYRACERRGTDFAAGSKAGETDPAFSPGGKSLAFASDAGPGQLLYWRGAFEDPCDILTGKPEVIARTGTGSRADPDFSPGGRRIVYVGRRNGGLRLMTIGVGGRGRSVVGRGIRGRAPQWTRLP